MRRPVGSHTGAVHALLRHFETAGFDGAPRAHGLDGRGREILTFVEGSPALPPIPSSDEALHRLGALVRRMHDAQEGFIRPRDADWHDGPLRPPPGDVVCHNDLFPPNVIFRDGAPVALIDWDLSAPGPPLYDVASAANFWAPLAHEERAAAFGLSNDRAGERLRVLCDGYGLARDERSGSSTSWRTGTPWGTSSIASGAASRDDRAGARCGSEAQARRSAVVAPGSRLIATTC